MKSTAPAQNTSLSETMALSALALFISVLSIGLIGFLFGFGLSVYTFIIAIAVNIGYSAIKNKKLLLATGVNLALLFIWGIICYFIFDKSFDGMYYHKQAIITLKEGWIPFYGSSLEADIFAGYQDIALWLDNYPKGIWIVSSVFYSITNLLETAKSVNILFLVPVFALGYDVFYEVYKFDRAKSLALSLVVVLNPVFICQVFTSYNDLAVGALFIITVFSCIKIYQECASGYTYAILFFTAAISCTIKFTAPLLVGIALLIFGVAYAIKIKFNIKTFKKPVITVLLAFIIGVVMLGFDPYVKHIAEGKHILYPVMGEGKYDIMNTNPPSGFENKNGPQKLFLSLFSRTDNILGKEPKLKIPFQIYDDEFLYLNNADTRIGGFGVLFGGILILSLLLLAATLIYKTKIKHCTIITLGLFILLALFFPESWWARYASFTYYVPIFILICGLRQPLFNWLKHISYGLILINSVIIIVNVVSTGIQTTNTINENLREIKTQNKKILVRVNDFPSHIKLFSEYGIYFNISHTALDNPVIFYETTKYKFVD